MTVDLPLLCAQPSCPLSLDGTCLDGFDIPSECPNARLNGADEVGSLTSDGIIDQGVGEREADEDDPDDVTHRAASTSYIGGDQALSLMDANDVAAMAPSTVVLVAGEFASGKTTLVVELWAQFLGGPCGDWTFAGSRTLAAFDRRHQPSRLSSGRAEPTTERTRDDDMRLLHLEIANHSGVRRSLLLSDVKGEFFGDLVDGRSVEEAVPLAKRADLCVLVIDGESAKDPAARAKSVWRSKLLIGALSEVGGLADGTRLLVVVSKGDLLTQEDKLSIQNLISPVLAFAAGRGLEADSVFVSARPEAAEDEPQGLQSVLEWIAEDDGTDTTPGSSAEPRSDRSRFFWREESE